MYHTQPSNAQFGLGKKKKEPSAFEQLQEQAKMGDSLTGLGGMGDSDLRRMIEEAMADPEAQAQMEALGQNFGAAMEQLARMSPEELEEQLQQAMNLLTEDSMVDNMVANRDEIIKQLEMTGGIPPEELARFKTDPQYFELKMRESFDQMKGMFNDPEVMKSMAEAMGSMQDILNSQQDVMDEISKLVSSGELSDDDKIEEARLTLLKGDYGENPILAEMMKADEMQEILQDKKKWRDSVKEGMASLNGSLGAGNGFGAEL